MIAVFCQDNLTTGRETGTDYIAYILKQVGTLLQRYLICQTLHLFEAKWLNYGTRTLFRQEKQRTDEEAFLIGRLQLWILLLVVFVHKPGLWKPWKIQVHNILF